MKHIILLLSFFGMLLSSLGLSYAGDALCTKEYAPVCGEIQVQCIRGPCPPISETYGNSCMMESAGAVFTYKGECLSGKQELNLKQNWDHLFDQVSSGKTVAEIHKILDTAELRLNEREIQNNNSLSLSSLYGFIHFLIEDTRGRFWVE